MKKILLFITIVSTVQSAISQCTDDGNQWAKSWTSCQSSTNPNPVRGDSHWILYEFIDFHYIDSSHIWNSNRIGESGAGIKDIIVDYSLDGITWTELGSFLIPQASEDQDYLGVTGPNFGSRYINKILITVLSTHDGDNCATIAEMLFAVDASKCHGVIDDCGICNGPGAPIWFIDADGDGKGSDSQTMESCTQPFGYVDNNFDICDSGQLGWDEIFPLFEASCNGCHIANTSGGLNLGTYESFSQGGFICGSDITTGDNLVSVITIDQYNGCDNTMISFPSMNDRTANPLSPTELETLQRWIDAGAPESCTDYCPESEIVNSTFTQGSIAYRLTSNEISSTAVIEESTLITYDAGHQMTMDLGFTVLKGGQFIAKMDGCE